MVATPFGYRLAPAFDLVPDVTGRADHTLAFQYDVACPTRHQLHAVADEWKVAKATAALDEVVRAVTRFAATSRKLGVSTGKGLETVRADVRRRLKLISQR